MYKVVFSNNIIFVIKSNKTTIFGAPVWWQISTTRWRHRLAHTDCDA